MQSLQCLHKPREPAGESSCPACSGLKFLFRKEKTTVISNIGGFRRPAVGRSVVSTRLGIVAANHPLAAAAGVRMLERGGNAVDAAIAANAMNGLLEPASNGIGGDLFVLYNDAKTGRTVGLNASGWSPAGLDADRLRSSGFTTMPDTGIHTVTVPGAVAGWDALRSRLGKLSFAEILAPAIHYAKEGFPVTEIIAQGWADCADRLHKS